VKSQEHAKAPRKRKRYLNPITFAVVAVIVVASATGHWPRGAGPEGAQFGVRKTAAEMIASRKASLPSTPPPLWKPVPGLLADHAQELELSPEQLQQVRALDLDWESAKQGFEQALEPYLSTEPKGSQREIAAGLEEYAALSRAYDARREAMWQESLGLLTAEQVQRLSRIRSDGGEHQ
jgi:hypothetical protein